MNSSPGILLISLDCEGLWGMADHLNQQTIATLSIERLRRAYDQIFGLLDRYGLPATFAAVSVFGEGREVLQAALPELNESAPHRQWFANVRRELDGRGAWFMPELPQRVIDSGLHEWATHGFCHIPFDHALMDSPGRSLELSAIAKYRLNTTPHAQVMVYPRNRIVQPELLALHGINAHRAAARLGKTATLFKVARLASEFNVMCRSDHRPTPGASEVIPGGRPLNWRSGLRQYVPIHVTAVRWRSIVNHALSHHGLVHLYLHPHNLVTGEQQIELLDRVLAELASGRRRGLMATTLGDFVRLNRNVTQRKL
jgi:hypothetical protein